MAKITYNILSMDLDSRKEIINNLKIINEKIEGYITERAVFSNYDIGFRLDKASVVYKNLYKKELSIEEKTICFLYTIFPSDEKFNDLIKIYDKNYDTIAKLYGVTSDFVRLRYLNMVNMRSLENSTKKLTLKNNNF